MPIFLLFLLFVLNFDITTCLGECGGEFTGYLTCLRKETKANSRDLELEFYLSLDKRIGECFDHESTKGTFCFLKNTTLTESSPYDLQSNCSDVFGGTNLFLCPLSILQYFFKYGLLVSNKEIRHCTDRNMVDIIKDETRSCLNSQLEEEFEFELPNFDRYYYKDKEYVEKSSILYIHAKKTMQECRPTKGVRGYNKKMRRFKRSASCWNRDDKKNSFLRPLHCEINQKCLQEREYACNVSDIFKHYCTCSRERRVQMVSKGIRMGEAVFAKYLNMPPENRTAMQCVEDIKERFRSSYVDLTDRIDDSLEDCGAADDLPEMLQQLASIVEFGILAKNLCETAFDGRKAEAEAPIIFFSNFLAAQWAKQTRYCTCV